MTKARGERRPPPSPRQRVAARLLLASITAALGLGLGTAVAVVGVLDLGQRDRAGFTAYLTVIGRGLVPAVTLTVLAAVLAAKALVTARRLRTDES